MGSVEPVQPHSHVTPSDKGNIALSGTVRYITNIKSSHLRPRTIHVDLLASSLYSR